MADNAADSLENLQLTEGDRQLIELAKGLANDPKTRKDFLKLVKAKHPEQVIPELDNETAMLAYAKPLVDKLTAMEKRELERSVNDKISARRAELREQGYTADDVKAIEEMMVKESIPSHATAANYYKLQKQAAQPTPSMANLTTKLPVDKKTIKEAGGVKNWARNEAQKAFDDLRSGRVKLPH